MTTYTRAQVATRLLKDCGLVGEDETPTSAAQADAEEIVQAGVGTLGTLGIPIWNGSDISVPHEYLLPVIAYLAPVSLRRNGQIDFATSTQLQKVAEVDLKRMAQVGPTGVVSQAEYF